MTNETDIDGPDGGTLHVYDSEGDGPPVVWFHGTPNLGAPPEPLFDAAERLGLRWIGYDRPGYGGSTPRPGRGVDSAAADAACLADALGFERFAAVGYSGGGPHALACAALQPDRVTAVVSIAGLAPYDTTDLDWFAGMCAPAAAALEAALEGREAKERYETDTEFDPAVFTAGDLDALAGRWAWLGKVAVPAVAGGIEGAIDDDLAFVAPWGFDPVSIAAPALFLHGEEDLVVPADHGRALARRCSTAETRWYADDGHVSILDHAESALEWLNGRDV